MIVMVVVMKMNGLETFLFDTERRRGEKKQRYERADYDETRDFPVDFGESLRVVDFVALIVVD